MSKKYNRTHHLPFSPGTTSDDRIAKSVDSLINCRVVITEKLDGENCGMTREGVYARSHATFTTSGWSREVRQLHSLIKNDISSYMTLFGENMEGIHSIEYSKLRAYFYLFGIRNHDHWLSWLEVEEHAYLIGLRTVPVLYDGVLHSPVELKDLVEGLVSKESALGGQREGIVIRKYDLFHDSEFDTSVMKWVRKNHVGTSIHWTRNWRKATLDIS